MHNKLDFDTGVVSLPSYRVCFPATVSVRDVLRSVNSSKLVVILIRFWSGGPRYQALAAAYSRRELVLVDIIYCRPIDMSSASRGYRKSSFRR